MADIGAAERLALRLLAGELPRRWAHVRGVAARAGCVPLVDASAAALLVSAAWLHDIGYAASLVETGFHPIDGARYLRRISADQRVVNLVAHHSCARVEADLRGLSAVLASEFPRDDRLPHDELCFCDQTTSPDGEVIDVFDRLAEIRVRYGPEHVVSRFVGQAEDERRGGLCRPRTDHLARTFGARWCRVESPRPGRAVLVFGRRDPLAHVVPALPVPVRPALRQLEVGRCEDGTPWRVQVAGSHLLVAGATGAGKGSVIWSIIRALAVPVHEGRVQLWCIDPKGGMELSAGAAMFHRFAYDTPAGMADLLDDAVDELHARAQRMRVQGHRSHSATVGEPLVVLVVDELAFLTAYQPDTALRKRINASLSVLLSKGRAVGFSVVAALQDPRKEVAPIRDLFPARIGLRLTEPEQSRLVLGTGAHDRGAECEAIPVGLPGVGFVVLDGLPDPVRVRASWVTDDDIAAMAVRYPARRGDVIDTIVVDSSTASPGTAVVEVEAREPAA